MRPFVTHMLCAKGTPAAPPPPPPPTLGVSVSPSSGSATSSGSQGFSASVSGATGAISYSWGASASSGSATVSGSGSSVTVSWSGLTSGGTIYVSCSASDSVGATGSGAGILTRSTAPAMTNVVLSTSGSPYISVGLSYGVQVNATPVGGEAPYSYSWAVDNFDGITSSGASAIPYMTYVDGTRTKTGNVYCTTTDANGTSIFRSIGLLSITY